MLILSCSRAYRARRARRARRAKPSQAKPSRAEPNSQQARTRRPSQLCPNCATRNALEFISGSRVGSSAPSRAQPDDQLRAHNSTRALVGLSALGRAAWIFERRASVHNIGRSAQKYRRCSKPATQRLVGSDASDWACSVARSFARRVQLRARNCNRIINRIQSPTFGLLRNLGSKRIF